MAHLRWVYYSHSQAKGLPTKDVAFLNFCVTGSVIEKLASVCRLAINACYQFVAVIFAAALLQMPADLFTRRARGGPIICDLRRPPCE